MTDIVERLENWGTVYEEDDDCDGSLYLAARDEILRLREGWQPIESAPKDGSLFIAANVDDAAQNPCIVYYECGSWAFGIIPHIRTSTHDMMMFSAFTHWRHLPDPPQKNNY